LDLIKKEQENGLSYETIRLEDVERNGEPASSAMHTVFDNGEVYPYADESLDVIRERASGEFGG
jgi:hypothetical protein